MCGICGVVARPERPLDAAPAVARMVETLRPRGPDGAGQRTFVLPGSGPSVTLGHTRLAIIDLSPAGLQPMASEDGHCVLVLNGEVYDFARHRQRLQAGGRRFRSRTDSEVVLALYEERGAALLPELDGMFALALLDLRARRLLLARDALGVKPLFYAPGPPFAFASEPKALLASGLVDAEVDWQAVADYFTFLYVPHPQTAFRGIRELPPGHSLEVDLDSGALRLARFFRPRRRPELERLPPGEARALLRDTVAAAVRRQLVSDVPLGVFLSGGIDSSIVAGLAREAGPLRTCTVVFDDPGLRHFDERAAARAASRHLGTEHEELPLQRLDPFDLLDDVGLFDQPFGNPTSHLLRLLSRRARPHMTVALCGAGGDELFAGYPRYRAHRLARRLRLLPRGLLRGAGRLLQAVPDGHRGLALRRAREFLAGLDADPVRQFANWTYFLDAGAKADLLRRAPLNGAHLDGERLLRAVMEESALADAGNRLLELDVLTFLPDNLLAYTDRASMASALEVRVPLLDREVVEVALNLPFGLKLRGGTTKAVLREAFAGLLAPEVARGGKRGFNVPLALWMRELDAYFDAPPALRERFGPELGQTWRSGLLSADAIQRLRHEHRRGAADWSSELFAIAVFDRWWGRYIAQRPTS